MFMTFPMVQIFSTIFLFPSPHFLLPRQVWEFFCLSIKTKVDHIIKLRVESRKSLILLHPYTLKFGGEYLDFRQLHNRNTFMGIERMSKASSALLHVSILQNSFGLTLLNMM